MKNLILNNMKKLIISITDFSDPTHFDKVLDVCNPSHLSRMRMENKPILLQKSNRSVQLKLEASTLDQFIDRIEAIVKVPFGYMTQPL